MKISLKIDLEEILQKYFEEIKKSYYSIPWAEIDNKISFYKNLAYMSPSMEIVQLCNKYIDEKLKGRLQSDRELYNLNTQLVVDHDKNSRPYDQFMQDMNQHIDQAIKNGKTHYSLITTIDTHTEQVIFSDSIQNDIEIITLPDREFLYWYIHLHLNKLQEEKYHRIKMATVYLFSFFEICVKEFVKTVKTHDPSLNLKIGPNLEKTKNRLQHFNFDMSQWPEWAHLLRMVNIRHSIVHNSGIWDQEAIDTINENQNLVGTPVNLKFEDIRKLFVAIKKCLREICDGLINFYP